jgi:hypothetical protein
VSLLMVVAVAGCGSSSSSTSSSTTSPTGSVASSAQTSFAKTKFVLHAGLAFGAFHRYIYKPFKAGRLSGSGLLRHKLTVAKAVLAGLFVYHELKLALEDARSSPLLSKLLSPLTALQTSLVTFGAKLKSGQARQSDLNAAGNQIESVASAAAAAGQPITEAAPTLRQLRKGAN